MEYNHSPASETTNVRRQGRGRRALREPDQTGNDLGLNNNNNLEEQLEASTSSTTAPVNTQTVSRAVRVQGRRIKWTREMNIKIMESFYRVNNAENRALPGWRSKFYDDIRTNVFPELSLTEQNVVDRKSAIIKKKYLNEIELDEIREKIRREQSTNPTVQQTPTAPNIQEIQISSDSEDSNIDTQETRMRQEDQDRQLPGNTETNQEARELSNLEKEFYSNLRFFEGGHPVDRPMLPKLIMKRDTMKKVQHVNEILERYLGDSEDLSHVQLGIYIGAATTLEANGQRKYHERNARRRDIRNKDAEPPWMKRIKKQIGELRAKADVIASYLTGNRSARMQRKMKNIMKQGKISETDDHLKEKLVELKDTVRQTYKAKSARLRRYTELTKRKEQNKDFTRNPKQFFKKLSQNLSESGEGQIEEEEFVTFWERIWSNKKDWNEQNTWLPKVNESLQRVERMQDNTVSREEIATIAAKLSNWKSPGADKVQNFWVKKFTAAHGPLARVFSKALRNPESIPDWLMLGKTYLIYKKDDPKEPRNYRPITCLSVFYKLMTSVIAEKIYKHCDANEILALEQKGCTRKTLGCKEQLTIDATILKQATTKKRNLNICYIDYSKAYDSTRRREPPSESRRRPGRRLENQGTTWKIPAPAEET
ncbi:hypothetical protein M8J75_003197 [Diaphorina citri]|nr:hypothetical protein M8J75_003197 [Diaphorina citri]